MAKTEFQVVIVGGGAAGVAAARWLHDAGVDALILEARDRLGGRAWSVADPSGNVLDLGCSWLHSADRNPWREIAEERGMTIDRTPPPWTRTSAQTGFSKSEQAEFVATLMDFRQRCNQAGPEEPDRAASTLLEPGGRWNALIDAISTLYSGAELDRVSLRDLARYEDTGVNWRVVDGYGALIAGHASGLPAKFNCRAERIDHRGRLVRIETPHGAVLADAVIVTLPSNILAEEADLFLPALPGKVEAAAGLPLGLADKLFLSLANAEEFERDSRSFGHADRSATAAYHIRPFGRSMIEAYFGGALAAELEKGGEPAFFDFAADELKGLFGHAFARRIRPIRGHCWRRDPFARGSYSYALPGKADCRATLAAAVEQRLFFAGEACSREDFSTAHGAYRTGVAAAEEALAALRAKRAPSRAGATA